VFGGRVLVLQHIERGTGAEGRQGVMRRTHHSRESGNLLRSLRPRCTMILCCSSPALGAGPLASTSLFPPEPLPCGGASTPGRGAPERARSGSRVARPEGPSGVGTIYKNLLRIGYRRKNRRFLLGFPPFFVCR
jgi:hypothetical protein